MSYDYKIVSNSNRHTNFKCNNGDCTIYTLFKKLLRLFTPRNWKALLVIKVFVIWSIFFILNNKGRNFSYFQTFPQNPPQILWGYRQDLVNQGDWQEILEIGSGDEDIKATKFFVYSAYHDFYKSENILRIIAVTPSHSKKPLFCYLFDENRQLLGVVGGKVKSTLWAVTYFPYSSGFILCNLQPLLESLPDNASTIFLNKLHYVAISPLPPDSDSNENIMLSNLLPVKMISKSAHEPHEFGLCVQPAFNFNKTFAFIQFIEFYRLMGVTHFSFYNISMSSDILCVIEYYLESKETEISVLPWAHAPFPNDSHAMDGPLLHHHAQVAQIDDCILRYRGLARYVVGIDFDEYLLPSRAKNFHELILTVDKQHKQSQGFSFWQQQQKLIAQYQFRQRFFGVECTTMDLNRDDDAQKNQVILEDLLLYRHVQSTSELTPHNIRSKYISVPKLVVEPGVHWMREGVGSSVEVKVDESLAYIRHFREDCAFDSCPQEGIEIDMLGFHYAPLLLPRVSSIVEKVVGHNNNSCNLELSNLRQGMYLCEKKGN